MADIIIIGAGIAGLSAAIYASRAGKKVIVLEGKACGGQIVNTPNVENYPGISKISGYDLSNMLFEQAKECGAEIKMQAVKEIKKTENGFSCATRRNVYEAPALIIASGAVNRHLELSNEEKLTGYGVSYCATCDGAFFKGKKVAVVGGGNTAFEDAEFLASYCEKVYLIHRRDEFRAEPMLVDRLKQNSNVEFILNHVPSALISEKGPSGEESLTGLTIENRQTKEKTTLDVSGVFVAIGQIPNTELFGGLVELDDKGYIVGKEDCLTSCPGIFVAGDCRTKKVRQLTTAASDGAVAALAASEYLSDLKH